jgi:hypothetical protein
MKPTRTRNRLLHAAPLLGAMLFLSGTAAASTTLMPTGEDTSLGMKTWVDAGGQNEDVYAGVIYITLNQNGQQYYRDTLCADLFDGISLNTSYDTQLLTPDQVAGKNLPRAAWLVENALAPMLLPGSVDSALPSSDWVTTAAQGAGLQLALWDISDDGANGFSTGQVQATAATNSTVLYWAEQYESLSLGQSSDLPYVYDNTNPSNGQAAQMLLSPQYSDGGPEPAPPETDSPTPEPAAFLLVGAGLVAGSLALRRIHRTR